MRVMMEELERLRAGDRDLADTFVRARRQVMRIAASSGLARQVMELTVDDVGKALAVELAASRQVIAIVG